MERPHARRSRHLPNAIWALSDGHAGNVRQAEALAAALPAARTSNRRSAAALAGARVRAAAYPCS